MKIALDHYHHFPTPPVPDQHQVLALLRAIQQQQENFMVTLTEALAADEAAEARIIAVLQAQSGQLTDLAAKLVAAIAAGGDAAQVQQVADQMLADAATMQAAADAAQPPTA